MAQKPTTKKPTTKKPAPKKLTDQEKANQARVDRDMDILYSRNGIAGVKRAIAAICKGFGISPAEFSRIFENLTMTLPRIQMEEAEKLARALGITIYELFVLGLQEVGKQFAQGKLKPTTGSATRKLILVSLNNKLLADVEEEVA